MSAATTVAAVAAVAAAGVGAYGQIQAGKEAQAQANYQAKVAEKNASLSNASAQREAQEELRKSRIANSRALAVAGASGAGASDPTVVNIMQDIAGEGEYRAMTALFNGEARGTVLQDQADADRISGSQAKTAGYIGGAGTAIGGVGNALYYKYGGASADKDTGDGDPLGNFSLKEK